MNIVRFWGIKVSKNISKNPVFLYLLFSYFITYFLPVPCFAVCFPAGTITLLFTFYIKNFYELQNMLSLSQEQTTAERQK